ncbi:hypothetical protein NDU88_000856 [Pleurodeles waltl]|uniref:Uncharacterized protein n=1 Tax=Pleurodeles waltl TaxID=8319 RepID=A0AAV7L813_PLEWA|nr:hypothetical protein NDU88_000856 [Pleurodeles waltl]
MVCLNRDLSDVPREHEVKLPLAALKVEHLGSTGDVLFRVYDTISRVAGTVTGNAEDNKLVEFCVCRQAMNALPDLKSLREDFISFRSVP